MKLRISAYQFAVVRFLLSLYFIYFFQSLLWAREPAQAISILFRPGFHPESLRVSVGLGLVASLCFLVGFIPKCSSLVALICFQFVLFILPVAHSTDSAYISFVLFIYFIFYRQNLHGSFFLCYLTRKDVWHLPFLLAAYLSFTISGLSKLFFSPWMSGQLIRSFCPASPIAKLIDICTSLPTQPLAYLVVLIEILSFPMALFAKTRLFIWLLNTALHIGILLFIKIWPVSLAFLLLQLFLFDFRWLGQFSDKISVLESGRSARVLTNRYQVKS